jgi:hypothetical protein
MSKADLGDVLVYLCTNYPENSRDDLSNARLTKLVYLADWKSARHTMGQITDIKWVLNHYGPWVPDVINTVKNDKRLTVLNDSNMFGSEKKTVALDEAVPIGDRECGLSEEVQIILDSVIADTQNLYFGQFVEHVYETYPVRHRHRFGELDLVLLAREEAREEDNILPVVDFKSAGLSAVSYASLRDEVSRIVARSLLGRTVAEASLLNPKFHELNGKLEDSVLRNYYVAPEMTVNKVATDQWQCSVEGTIDISGVLPLSAAHTANELYKVVDSRWDESAVLAEVDCTFEAKIRVRRDDDKGWTGEVQDISIDRETIIADLHPV